MKHAITPEPPICTICEQTVTELTNRGVCHTCQTAVDEIVRAAVAEFTEMAHANAKANLRIAADDSLSSV